MNSLDQRILEIGTDLLERAHSAEPKFYQPAWAEQRLLNWIIQDDRLKQRLFRFIEVLPALRTDREIANYLKLYLSPNGDPLPGVFRFALGYATPDSLRGKLAARATRYNAQKMAQKFVPGSTAEQAIKAIKLMRRQKRAFTIDLLGEAVTSERQAERVTQTYIELIRDLGIAAKRWPRVHPIDFDSTGAYPIVNISVKLTALYSQFDPVARERTMAVVGDRLASILRAARKYDAFVNVDVEQYRYKDITLQQLEIVPARANLFNDWLKSRGKLGGQHKVPRLSNTRDIIEQILAFNV